MRRFSVEFVNEVLEAHARHAGDRSDGGYGACCVFVDEIEALRAELADVHARAHALVGCVHEIAARGVWTHDRSIEAVYDLACALGAQLPPNPKAVEA